MLCLRTLVSRAALVIGLALLPGPARAICSFDATDVALGTATELCPQLVDISKDCLGRAEPECFEDPGALQSFETWFVQIKSRPIAERPLLVRIGPGTFADSNSWFLACGDNVESPLEHGFTTIRGAGRSATVLDLRPGMEFLWARIGLVSWLCHEMHFSDMTVESEKYGVSVAGGGDTTWSRMDVEVGSPLTGGSVLNIGWQEESCGTRPDGSPFEHYLFDVRFRVRAKNQTNVGYHAPCDHNWFFSGEIDVTGDAIRNGSTTDLIGVDVKGGGRFVGLDSRIRVETGDFTTGALGSAAGVTGVHVSGDEREFHMHGGLISVDASGHPGANATAIHAEGDTHAHAFGTESRVTAGPPATGVAAGTPRRLFEQGGMIHSTQFWGAAADPPRNADHYLLSLPGADLFVETDCNASGNCNASGSEAHLMIMNAERCGDPADATKDPWFDNVTRACRTSP